MIPAPQGTTARYKQRDSSTVWEQRVAAFDDDGEALVMDEEGSGLVRARGYLPGYELLGLNHRPAARVPATGWTYTDEEGTGRVVAFKLLTEDDDYSAPLAGAYIVSEGSGDVGYVDLWKSKGTLSFDGDREEATA